MFKVGCERGERERNVVGLRWAVDTKNMLRMLYDL